MSGRDGQETLIFTRGGPRKKRSSHEKRQNKGLERSSSAEEAELMTGLELVAGEVHSENSPNGYHRLETPWTFYYLDPDVPAHMWNIANKDVISFRTVEEFWGIVKLVLKIGTGHSSTVSLFNAWTFMNVESVSNLRNKSDYSLFRGGLDMPKIRPEYEDPQNKPGGFWRVQLSQSLGARVIDNVFKELLMMLVGEQFGVCNSVVNGVVVAFRSGFFRFAIWTQSRDEESCLPIGQSFAKVLPPHCHQTLEFCVHENKNRPLFKV